MLIPNIDDYMFYNNILIKGEKMKVLHIIPSLASGGAEKMLVDIVKEMKKENIEIEVAVLTQKDNFFGNKLSKLNIPIHYGPTEKVYSIKNIFFLSKLVRNNNYDIIHTHLFAPQLFVPIALKIGNNKDIKLITTEHSTHNRRRDKKIFFQLDRWMYRQYDSIIAITNGTKNELFGYLPETYNKTIVINNGIDINQYRYAKPLKSLKEDYQIPKENKLVLMVAAMREQKDHETLIRASKLLPDDFTVIFVGDGERFQKVKEYANLYGKNIVFLGKRSDVPSIMASSDIFVLSSKWEGFGLVVVEAAASGLPVVASDVDGLREVVQDIGGTLFEPGNEFELAKKIIEIIENNNKRYTIYSKYTIQDTVKKYINIYKSITN